MTNVTVKNFAYKLLRDNFMTIDCKKCGVMKEIKKYSFFFGVDMGFDSLLVYIVKFACIEIEFAKKSFVYKDWHTSSF